MQKLEDQLIEQQHLCAKNKRLKIINISCIPALSASDGAFKSITEYQLIDGKVKAAKYC